MIWRDINAVFKIYLFTTSKKLCATIGYRSTKFHVSFSEVPAKLRILIMRILIYFYYCSISYMNIGERLSLFFGFLVFCVSFLCCCLVSFWEYQLNNLSCFSVFQLQAWEWFQMFAVLWSGENRGIELSWFRGRILAEIKAMPYRLD